MITRIPGLWIGTAEMGRTQVANPYLLAAGGLLAAALLLAACGQAFEPDVPPAAAGSTIEAITPQQAGEAANALPEASHTPTIPTDTPPPATAFPTPTPGPTATPQPKLHQLTGGGCCAQPFWSPDSSQVWFLDKPEPDSPPGFWAVGIDGGPAFLAASRLGIYSPDLQLIAYPEAGQTLVERLVDGQRWVIPNEGRAVSFSPDSAWVAWTAGQSGPPFDSALREVWISRPDGSQAQMVQRVTGGGFAGWLSGGRVLFSGRLSAEENQAGYFAASPGGAIVELARGERLRGAVPSPDGNWLAYQVAFAADPQANGLWMLNTNSLERVRLPTYGAFRWRSDQALLVVPLDPGQPSHQVFKYLPAEDRLSPLTDPQVTPFKIANGDWSVSPDGRFIAFVSAADLNIWLLEIP